MATMYTCDICAAEQFRWPPRLPVCNCKTLNRCAACHFKQLSAPGKNGICDVCNTERCEVSVLSAMPFTSQLYPWTQALHTDAVTWERCPTLLFQCSPRCFDVATMISMWITGVAVGCVLSMALASGDELFSVLYCVMIAFLALQSVVDSLSLAVYAAPGQDRYGAYRSRTILQVILWSLFIAAIIWICSTLESRALLVGLFVASRFPGWCVDAALIVRMRQYLASQLKEEHVVVVEQRPPGAVPP